MRGNTVTILSFSVRTELKTIFGEKITFDNDTIGKTICFSDQNSSRLSPQITEKSVHPYIYSRIPVGKTGSAD